MPRNPDWDDSEFNTLREGAPRAIQRGACSASASCEALGAVNAIRSGLREYEEGQGGESHILSEQEFAGFWLCTVTQ